MIYIGIIAGVLAGIAGHKTDHLIEYLEQSGTPRTWTLSSRYGIGYLIALFIFSLLIFRKDYHEEATGYMLIAGVSVGVGTLAGHVLDALTDK